MCGNSIERRLTSEDTPSSGMSSEANIGPETTSPGVEFLRVAALLGVFAVQLYLASRIAKLPSEYCFTRPLWLDEFHTLAL